MFYSFLLLVDPFRQQAVDPNPGLETSYNMLYQLVLAVNGNLVACSIFLSTPGERDRSMDAKDVVYLISNEIGAILAERAAWLGWSIGEADSLIANVGLCGSDMYHHQRQL